MAHLLDYEELDLTGMDIDMADWSGEVLRTNFGSRYGSTVRTGPAYGAQDWVISSGALPSETEYGTINSLSRFDYYYDFFQRHTTGERDIFVIDYRDKKYHASFTEERISFERFTNTLYAGEGVAIRQRQVRGVHYNAADGSIFYPSDLTGLQAWYAADAEANTLGTADNLEGTANRDLVSTDFPYPELTELTNSTVWRFPASGNYMLHGETFNFSHGFIVAAYADAAFGGATEGLCSSNSTYGMLVADGTTTKFFDLAYAGLFSYTKNGTAYANANLQAPMSGELGVMEFIFTAGIASDGFQIGQDRGFGTRLWDGDVAEVLLYNDTGMTTTERESVIEYLRKKYQITLD